MKLIEIYPPWIPVSDNLPDEYQTVLIGYKKAPVITAYRVGHAFYLGNIKYDAIYPAHWMPLPAPPGEVE